MANRAAAYADQAARIEQHEHLTAQIVALETRMNYIVYEAFDLSTEEHQLIEDTTKYRYGEV